ncbi:MAG: hypothetical protein M3O15_00560 [Acidobacteriota bacterium]|nr:hypothetical protein [Acidobacteriota bacterium]
MVRTALREAALDRLSWFDAHLWAYAEFYGLPVPLSEDFEHDRLYGSVRVVSPFLSGVSGQMGHEVRAEYRFSRQSLATGGNGNGGPEPAVRGAVRGAALGGLAI